MCLKEKGAAAVKLSHLFFTFSKGLSERASLFLYSVTNQTKKFDHQPVIRLPTNNWSEVQYIKISTKKLFSNDNKIVNKLSYSLLWQVYF